MIKWKMEDDKGWLEDDEWGMVDDGGEDGRW
jgi:hypothetical protein